MTARLSASDLRAAEVVKLFRAQGLIVRKVIIEGKRLEVDLDTGETSEFDDVDL